MKWLQKRKFYEGNIRGTYLNACGLYIGGKQYGKYEYKYEDLTPADYQ